MNDTKCTGWWEQNGQRHAMESLRMVVAEGKITGSGIDIVGTFTFDGTVSDDHIVSMTKQYLGQHAVTYTGMYNGSNRLWGTCRIIWMKGPWEITLNSEQEEAEEEQQEDKVKL